MFFRPQEEFFTDLEKMYPSPAFNACAMFIKAVKSLIRDLKSFCRICGLRFFKIINDVAYNGFFTFIPRIHFHTDRDLVGIQEQAPYRRSVPCGFLLRGLSVGNHLLISISK